MNDRGEPPPVPLILAAWWATSTADKYQRWLDTQDWTGKRGLQCLIPVFPPDHYLAYAEETGPVLYPEYKHHEQKPIPDIASLARALDVLKERWKEIAGPFLYPITRPISFTGRKKRFLLVEAKYEIKPPWGTWKSFIDRRSFTEFRRSVNHAISPHEIDHIDFKPCEKS